MTGNPETICHGDSKFSKNEPSPTKIWEHGAIFGNRMGTITVSKGVYRAFRSDQGLVSLAFTLRRKNGMEEVVGSIPTRSTKTLKVISRTFKLPRPKYQHLAVLKKSRSVKIDRWALDCDSVEVVLWAMTHKNKHNNPAPNNPPNGGETNNRHVFVEPGAKIDVVERIWKRHETDRSEDKDSQTKQLRWTRITAVLVFVYTGFSAYQVKIAKDTYKSSQRPYVGVNVITPTFISLDANQRMVPHVGPTEDSVMMGLIAHVKNFGPVPGTNFKATWAVYVDGQPVHDSRDTPPGKQTIFPTEMIDLGPARIGAPNYDDVIHGKKE